MVPFCMTCANAAGWALAAVAAAVALVALSAVAAWATLSPAPFLTISLSAILLTECLVSLLAAWAPTAAVGTTAIASTRQASQIDGDRRRLEISLMMSSHGPWSPRSIDPLTARRMARTLLQGPK